MKTNKLKSAILFLVFLQSNLVFGSQNETVSPSTRLRKLSLSLKGTLPMPSEYRNLLNAKTETEINEFFKAKSDEYTKSDAFYNKLAFKTIEEFSLHVKSSQQDTEGIRLSFLKDKVISQKAVKGFNIAPLLKSGLNWNQILSTDAVLVYNSAAGKSSTNSISEQVLTELLNKPNSNLGILSTNYFKERFVQTQYSKAAATYRIFLCDVMTPIALGAGSINLDSHKDLNNLSKVKTVPQDKTATQDKTTSSKSAASNMTNPHVQEACIGCHKKLDPARDLFLSTTKFPIQFVYTDDEGVNKSFEIKSPTDFVAQVMQQDQYVNCQVKRFWKWYIGEDVSMTPKIKEDLKNLYKETQKENLKENSVGQFVSRLVNLKEYYTEPDLQNPNFSSVRPILKSCDQCHSSLDAVSLPDFGGKVPYQLNLGSVMTAEQITNGHIAFLNDILSKTHFHEMGKNAEMPPPAKLPSLNLSEFVALARWINAGAKDDSGKNTINAIQAAQILQNSPLEVRQALSQKKSLPSNLPFWKRYIENYDLIFMFEQLFSINPFNLNKLVVKGKSEDGVVCNLQNLQKIAKESTYSLLNRKIISEKPTEFLFTTLQSCVDDFYDSAVKDSLQANPQSLLAIYLGYEFKSYKLNQFDQTTWGEINQENKNILIRTLIRTLIGPDVLSIENENSKIQIIHKILNSDLNSNKESHVKLSEVTKKILLNLLQKEIFLSY